MTHIIQARLKDSHELLIDPLTSQWVISMFAHLELALAGTWHDWMSDTLSFYLVSPCFESIGMLIEGKHRDDLIRAPVLRLKLDRLATHGNPDNKTFGLIPNIELVLDQDEYQTLEDYTNLLREYLH